MKNKKFIQQYFFPFIFIISVISSCKVHTDEVLISWVSSEIVVPDQNNIDANKQYEKHEILITNNTVDTIYFEKYKVRFNYSQGLGTAIYFRSNGENNLLIPPKSKMGFFLISNLSDVLNLRFDSLKILKTKNILSNGNLIYCPDIRPKFINDSILTITRSKDYKLKIIDK